MRAEQRLNARAAPLGPDPLRQPRERVLTGTRSSPGIAFREHDIDQAAVAAPDGKLALAADDDLVAAGRTPPHREDAVAIDDMRAVDAHETPGIEPLQDRAQRLAVEIARRIEME